MCECTLSTVQCTITYTCLICLLCDDIRIYSDTQQKKVVLLSEHQQPVGMGFLSTDSDTVDNGMVKVTVDYVQPETKNPTSEDAVEVGQLTAWPARLISYA